MNCPSCKDIPMRQEKHPFAKKYKCYKDKTVWVCPKCLKEVMTDEEGKEYQL